MRHFTRASLVFFLSALPLLLLWTNHRPVHPGPAPAQRSFSPRVPDTSAAPALLSPPATADRKELARRCLHLAETDPLAAMDLAIAQKLTDDDRGLLTTLILRWADQDFSGALEWARAQPHDAGRDDILAHLAYLRSQSQPSGAAEIAAAEISDPRARTDAIISVVHQWARRSPSGARNWAGRLTDPALRSRALDEIAAVRTQQMSLLAVGTDVH